MGRAEERRVFSCGPCLSASTQSCPENSCAPSCPDPKAVAGTQGVEVTFLAVLESLGTKQAYLSLLWACQATKRGMAGTICTSWLIPTQPLRLRIPSSRELSLASPDCTRCLLCVSLLPLVTPCYNGLIHVYLPLYTTHFLRPRSKLFTAVAPASSRRHSPK